MKEGINYTALCFTIAIAIFLGNGLLFLAEKASQLLNQLIKRTFKELSGKPVIFGRQNIANPEHRTIKP